MKMEIAGNGSVAGVVQTLNCAPGMLVSAGQTLAAIRGEGA